MQHAAAQSSKPKPADDCHDVSSEDGGPEKEASSTNAPKAAAKGSAKRRKVADDKDVMSECEAAGAAVTMPKAKRIAVPTLLERGGEPLEPAAARQRRQRQPAGTADTPPPADTDLKRLAESKRTSAYHSEMRRSGDKDLAKVAGQKAKAAFLAEVGAAGDATGAQAKAKAEGKSPAAPRGKAKAKAAGKARATAKATTTNTAEAGAGPAA